MAHSNASRSDVNQKSDTPNPAVLREMSPPAAETRAGRAATERPGEAGLRAGWSAGGSGQKSSAPERVNGMALGPRAVTSPVERPEHDRRKDEDAGPESPGLPCHEAMWVARGERRNLLCRPTTRPQLRVRQLGHDGGTGRLALDTACKGAARGRHAGIDRRAHERRSCDRRGAYRRNGARRRARVRDGSAARRRLAGCLARPVSHLPSSSLPSSQPHSPQPLARPAGPPGRLRAEPISVPRGCWEE